MEEKEGIRIDKGIRVEENMRKYEKNVYEIGDCERYDNFNEGRNVRMEQVKNEKDKEKNLERKIVGREKNYREVEWLW